MVTRQELQFIIETWNYQNPDIETATDTLKSLIKQIFNFLRENDEFSEWHYLTLAEAYKLVSGHYFSVRPELHKEYMELLSQSLADEHEFPQEHRKAADPRKILLLEKCIRGL